MWPLALEKGVENVYWKVGEWTGTEWGNVGFVYLCLVVRVAFLLGFGVKKVEGRKVGKKD